jgi:hypothetical protein
MSQENPTYQCDDLLLLVGTNPLPNWVAAQTLLKPGGRIHLIYTRGVEPHAGRLREVLENKNNTPDVAKLPVSWLPPTADADAQKIYNDVKVYAARLLQNPARKLGLNYTGGTKMMAVHAHRAVMEVVEEISEKAKKKIPCVLSYLDARTLEFKFDSDYASFKPVCPIKIATLFDLHEDWKSGDYEQTVECLSAARSLVDVHSNFSGQRIWRKWCEWWKQQLEDQDISRIEDWKLKKEPAYRQNVMRVTDQFRLQDADEFKAQVEKDLIAQKGKDKKTRYNAAEVQRRLDKIVNGYQQMLTELNAKAGRNGDTLLDIARQNGFDHSAALYRWLDGMWLEHYTLAAINQCEKTAGLNADGMARNIETRNRDGRRFEVDAIALRGYQLFYFSCYAGSEFNLAKSKLFEAIERASQLGGDEAKSAIICCLEDEPDRNDAQNLRRQSEADWLAKTQNQVEVFGRSALPVLAQKLQEWFTRKR